MGRINKSTRKILEALSIRFPTDYYVFLSKLIIVIHDWRERLISSLKMNLLLRKMSCPRMTRPDWLPIGVILFLSAPGKGQHYYHHQAYKVSAGGLFGAGGSDERGDAEDGAPNRQMKQTRIYMYTVIAAAGCTHTLSHTWPSARVCECVCSISFGLFSGNNISWHW